MRGREIAPFSLRKKEICLDKIPKKVYNKIIERRKQEINAKRWKGEWEMDSTKDILEIIKDLIEILVLVLTARQLMKHKKSKKSKKKK